MKIQKMQLKKLIKILKSQLDNVKKIIQKINEAEEELRRL